MTKPEHNDWQTAAGLAGAVAMTRLVKMARAPGRLSMNRDRQFDAFAEFLMAQFEAACIAEKLTQDEIDNLLASIEDRVAEARDTIGDRN